MLLISSSLLQASTNLGVGVRVAIGIVALDSCITLGDNSPWDTRSPNFTRFWRFANGLLKIA